MAAAPKPAKATAVKAPASPAQPLAPATASPAPSTASSAPSTASPAPSKASSAPPKASPAPSKASPAPAAPAVAKSRARDRTAEQNVQIAQLHSAVQKHCCEFWWSGYSCILFASVLAIKLCPRFHLCALYLRRSFPKAMRSARPTSRNSKGP